MDFKPAKKQMYMWMLIFGVVGVIIFLSGYLPATIGKQVVLLDITGLTTVNNFILFYSIVVASVFGALIVLLIFYYKSVQYSFLKDKVVITKKLLVTKQKIIPFSDIIDVEEHQGLFEKLFGLMHLVMKTKERQSFIDRLLWGWENLPGIIIKSGIKNELMHRIIKS